MSKKRPLVVHYIENKDERARTGKVLYINGKKKGKFLSELEIFFDELEDKGNEDLFEFRNNVNFLIKKHSRKFDNGFYREDYKVNFRI